MAPPKSRTVRFGEKEAQRIEAFLRKNPFLDFSTLTRLAIARFIENPKLDLRPVPPQERPREETA